MLVFRVLTDKERLQKAEQKNRELLVRIEELTNALIELAEIVVEGEEKDG